MKAITITVPEELDADAVTEARRRGISKSELYRLGLRSILPDPIAVDRDDPWRSLAGFVDSDLSTEPGEIDDVVYGL
jgi:hypothetical protein